MVYTGGPEPLTRTVKRSAASVYPAAGRHALG